MGSPPGCEAAVPEVGDAGDGAREGKDAEARGDVGPTVAVTICGDFRPCNVAAVPKKSLRMPVSRTQKETFGCHAEASRARGVMRKHGATTKKFSTEDFKYENPRRRCQSIVPPENSVSERTMKVNVFYHECKLR